MPRRTDNSELIDGLLRITGLTVVTLATLLAPNGLQLLDKPIQKYFKGLDENKRAREFKRLIAYMHRQGLVTGHYDHGLKITDKARKRLEKLELDTLDIAKMKHWDKKWRMIFYDIPELKKLNRDQFAFRLRLLGCQQLQRSVWIHPFPCEQQIKALAVAFNVENYVTYLEVLDINNQKVLLQRFSHLI